MTFSTNQNRQFYVATVSGEAKTLFKDDATTQKAQVGTMGIKVVNGTCNKLAYFIYKGVESTSKTDIINLKHLDYIKLTKASDMVVPFKSVKVSLDTDTELILGQDYLLRIVFHQFYGRTDRDIYVKDAAVHVTSAMVKDVTKFYAAMVTALNMAFSRELGATKDSNPYLKFDKAADGITITEKEQPWRLGIESQQRVIFDVQPTTVYDGVSDFLWATVEGGGIKDVTPKKAAVKVGETGFGNGHQIADLEWFCMGERGDQYREIGFPNYIPTKYLVDPTKQYSVLDIHYHFKDSGVNSYNSEKEMTIVSTDDKVLSTLADALKKAAGITDAVTSTAASTPAASAGTGSGSGE